VIVNDKKDNLPADNIRFLGYRANFDIIGLVVNKLFPVKFIFENIGLRFY
jgi:hypothetical protein